MFCGDVLSVAVSSGETLMVNHKDMAIHLSIFPNESIFSDFDYIFVYTVHANTSETGGNNNINGVPSVF